MDIVDYSQARFEEIREDFSRIAARLEISDVRFVPVSALKGDNVVTHSSKMKWYRDECLLGILEGLYIESDRNLIDFRFPVQLVQRPNSDFRGYAGQIASGVIRVGSEVMVLPSERTSRIKSIETFDGSLAEAFAPMSVVLTLEDELDVARGDLLVHINNRPAVSNYFEAMLVWMDESPLKLNANYLVKHQACSSKVKISSIHYKVDVNTLSRESASQLELNEIGRVAIDSQLYMPLDPYRINRGMGGFILVDPDTNFTVAAGMILDRVPIADRSFSKIEDQSVDSSAVTLWLTGLSGSGKSSIAKEIRDQLASKGKPVCWLDGDSLRRGLCNDLGFSDDDRMENVRRVAELARILNRSGITAICSLISPRTEQRQLARRILGEGFREVYLSAPLEICEQRDPKGLYKQARAKKIVEFTGVSAPYEEPKSPDLALATHESSLSDCVSQIMRKFFGS